MAKTTFDLERFKPTKIISGEKQGKIRITWLNPSQYFYDIRTEDDAAPTSSDDVRWTRLDERVLIINQKDPVDVYFYAASEDGRILLDTEGPFLDVNLQDQTTPSVIVNFNKVTNSTELAAEALIDQNVIVVDDSTGIVAAVPGVSQGSYIILFDISSERFMFAKAVIVAGTTITLDTPLDFTFPAGTFVDIAVIGLNVDGSTTRQTFGLRGLGAPPGVDVKVDITRIILTCVTDDPVTLSLFGDVTELTFGLVLRKRNGANENIFNVKSNREMAGLTFDFSTSSAINPAQGENGFVTRLTFGGQSKIGVVKRLPIGEDLELIIQDDLSSLLKLECIAEGHVVD